MSGTIDYGKLMHRAMRELIRSVLEKIEDEGLPGAHHFFITFDTHHPNVALADWLADRYPDEMTIVVQHWFRDLQVQSEGFAITLNFGDRPEPIFVPFDAIKTFVDPSVEFGLRFETQDSEGDDDAAAPEAEAPMVEDVDEAEPDGHKDAEIVSLDTFRK